MPPLMMPIQWIHDKILFFFTQFHSVSTYLQNTAVIVTLHFTLQYLQLPTHQDLVLLVYTQWSLMWELLRETGEQHKPQSVVFINIFLFKLCKPATAPH